MSQCTYRCVLLPDWSWPAWPGSGASSQCTYRCVVLPDTIQFVKNGYPASQCTYRCVVLPDVQRRP